MVSVDPALMISSETEPSSLLKNSVSFSLLKPPYWTGISSAGMYLFVNFYEFLNIIAPREVKIQFPKIWGTTINRR